MVQFKILHNKNSKKHIQNMLHWKYTSTKKDKKEISNKINIFVNQTIQCKRMDIIIWFKSLEF
jgi:hypothetical protein